VLLNSPDEGGYLHEIGSRSDDGKNFHNDQKVIKPHRTRDVVLLLDLVCN
jgi:hypothetical protein